MSTQELTLQQLSKTVYDTIKKAHNSVKLRDNPKTFLTFKDCVLINNAYKFLQDKDDNTVIQECRDLVKSAQILEQGINICHQKGCFDLEEAVLVNDVLALFVQKVNSEREKQSQKPQPQQDSDSEQDESVMTI
jgi:hypothetical protein